MSKNELIKMDKKVIAVVGPPHSGKSVFLSHLFSYLQSFANNRFFLQRACPDGEGNWSAESDQDLVQQIRKKGRFNNTFLDFTIQSIQNLSTKFDLVLVDCGGRITEENRHIISTCTHFILLSSNRNSTHDWMNFCQDICHAKCLAVFDSTLDLKIESFFDQETLIGRLVGLDRNGVPDQTKKIIKKFGGYLCQK